MTMEEHKMVPASVRNLVGALDQGTSSTRFFIFASDTAEVITYHQIETKQLYPEAGWVEQDPLVILESVTTCIEQTVKKLKEFEIDPCDIKAIGVTNQRETTVVWNKRTGLPLYNAIIWLDNRTVDIVERLKMKRGSKAVKEKCGLPITTYFSATKLAWLIENVPEVNDAIEKNECLFGTIDSWLIWNLTGGINHGIHVTDVTNASNTMLLNIRSLKWDPWLCNFFQIPMSILPSVRSSSEILGFISNGAITGVPISGCLGDQSSALVGQTCFLPGSVKNTYGTGCFFLCNTGKVPVWSKHGLLTNVAYKLGPDTPAVYALEGSVAIAGAVFQWLRDNLEIISDLSYVETLASTFDSTHGVYFVPAFSGLYAPYWDPNARGILCGLTQFSTKAHIVRAALEAGCFQTCKIVDAMNLDTGLVLEKLNVDGGMTTNTLLMQIQADLLGIPVNLPSMSETTALGIAMVAGAAKGIEVWDLTTAKYSPVTSETFIPSISQSERELRCSMWEKAVKRSMNWEDESTERKTTKDYLLHSTPGGFFLLISFCILAAAEKLQK